MIFNRPLLTLFFGHVDKDVMDTSVSYFAWLSVSYPFLTMITAGGAILRVKRNTKVSFYVSIIRNVVNIIGNAVLIYGFKMGAEGAAIATAISRLVGAATIMMVVFSKKQEMRPGFKDIFHVDTKLMWRVTKVGLPTGIESSLFQLGRLLTLSMISNFGTAQIAANSTAGALTGIVVTIVASIRVASMTVIGQCVGAKDERQIRENYQKLMLGAYVLHGVAAALFVLFRYQLIGLYDSLAPETIEITAKLMCIHLLPAIAMYPLSFLITGPLRAANDSAFVMWVSIISMAVFRLTLAQVLCVNLEWGAVGVYVAMVVDWVCRSTCFLVRWHTGAWKKKCGLSK
jgi:putative MATE family efflux protein